MISTSQLELYAYPHNKLFLALVAWSSDFRGDKRVLFFGAEQYRAMQ